MNVVGVIPSRYGSTRLPAKALALIGGKPMVQHVYEQAKRATMLDEVLVATDDERIAQAVAKFGGRAMMTNAAHRSGTERVAEVARQLDAHVFLNIQGDEPLIRPEPINHIAQFLLAHRAVPMATVMTKLTHSEDIQNPHVVKVVVDEDGYALYFSRAPIPYKRGESSQPLAYWKHLGLYGYQRHFLLQYPHLAPTQLEHAEQLEQLRVLGHGHKIKVLETPFDSVGVDTAEDLQRVEQALVSETKR